MLPNTFHSKLITKMCMKNFINMFFHAVVTKWEASMADLDEKLNDSLHLFRCKPGFMRISMCSSGFSFSVTNDSSMI